MSVNNIAYKLNKYTFGDYEEVVFESEDQEIVIKEALERSAKDAETMKYLYAYRIEAWKDNKMIGGWRFFQDGREFTNDLKKAVGLEVVE